MHKITQILAAAEAGDPQAAERLLPLVYEELRKLAGAKLAAEQPGLTLQATALVHEAWLRLVGGDAEVAYRDRNHFFAVAAGAMRRILVDAARARKAEKRGGQLERQPLADFPAPASDEDLVALDEALRKLAGQDPVKAQLVELRYFAGLTGDQAAQVLGVSSSTVDRMWTFTRAWLQAEIRGR